MAEEKKVVDPFDLESVTETFNVAGHVLKLRPFRVIQLKRFIASINKAVGSITELSKTPEKATLESILEVLVGEGMVMMSVIFPKDPYDFMTPEFIENEFTVPMIRKIMERVVEMNGLGAVFPSLSKIGGELPSKPIGV